MSNISGKSLEPGDAFLRKVYTEAEIREAEKREVPLSYYATRFAGKEAVFKALNLSPDDIRLNEIEILNDPNGRPHATLLGNVARLAERQGITSVSVSLSYDTEYAIAFAVAENGG